MNDQNRPRADNQTLVVGAGGPLGQEVVRCLRAHGLDVVATVRRNRPDVIAKLGEAGARVERLDLDHSDHFAHLASSSNRVVMIPPLTKSWAAFSKLNTRHVERVLFFSSNNATVDFTSTFYNNLRKAEAEIEETDLNWTLLRPTMIFGYVGDTNIFRLMSFLKRLPIGLVPGAGKALQQPIYYKDLAKAAAGALMSERALRQILQLGGPEVMTLREMYRVVNEQRAVVPIPIAPLRGAARLCEKIGVPFPLSYSELRRMEIDKSVVSHPNLEDEHLPKTRFADAVDQLRHEWMEAR